MANQLYERRARVRIETEIDRNFFVEASAGSGKTTALVARMTAMVRAGIPVREICAITFTVNAAAEFYRRFQESLANAADNKEYSAQERENCRAALQEIDLAFMGTIDAFCRLLLSEHPAEAGIPADASICEDAEQQMHLRHFFADLQKGTFAASLPDFPQKAQRLAYAVERPADAFVSGMQRVLKLRNTDIQHTPPAPQPFHIQHQQEIADFCRHLDTIVSNPQVVFHGATGKVTKFAEMLDAFTAVRSVLSAQQYANWEEAQFRISKALYQIKDLQINPDTDLAALGITDSLLFVPKIKTLKTKGDVVESLQFNYKEHPLLQAFRIHQHAVLLDLLLYTKDAAADYLCKQGAATFFDTLLCLRDMLKADASRTDETRGRLAAHIAKRHKYYLLDEFQDTDPLQAEVFFYLAAETPQPNWYDCKPRGGALFIVGDPKQSIYHFRGADINSFALVQQQFQRNGGELLTLRKNFRSVPALCKWFNNVFTEMLPAGIAGQNPYARIPAVCTDGTDGNLSGVYAYRIGGEETATDVEKVCEIIRTLAHNPAFTIRTRKDKAPREICYSDFMVIMRNKKKFNDYADALSAYGIRSRIEGEINFAQCDALVTLAYVLQAAANPYDSEAVYHAWHTPLLHLDNNSIYALRQRGIPMCLCADYETRFSNFTLCANGAFRGRDRAAQPADNGSTLDLLREQLAAVRTLRGYAKKLQALSVYAKQMPFPELMNKAIKLLDLFNQAGTSHLEHLIFAQELIRQHVQDGTIRSAKEGAAFLMQMVTKPEKERSLSLTKNPDCVHFANLHKVKGLEAPIVILANPGKTESTDPPAMHIERTVSGAKSWLFDLDKLHTPAYPQQEEAEAQAEEEEDARLRYVAATRAKCALIVVDRRLSKKGEKDYLISKENFWAEFTPYLSQNIEDLLAGQTAPKQQQTNANQASPRLTLDDALKAAQYQQKTPSRLAHAARPVARDQAEGNLVIPLPDADLLGTMVHKMMECIVSSGDAFPAETLCEAICREYDAPQHLARLEAVFAQMHSGGYPQKNGMPADILPVLLSADEVCCELPFSECLPDETGAPALWYGIMDIVYKKDGAWHIVDYKTSADDTALDADYAAQLSAYAAAFQRITGETADAHTYHIAAQA